MKERLLSPNTNLEDRKRMLDGLAFVEDPSAAVALMDAAAAKDFPLKDQSLWWLKNRRGNLWKEYGIDQALMERGLVQVADVKLTAVEIPETPKGAPELPSVAEIARLAGDPGRGKTAVGVCYACHRIGSQGIEFGPDLTTFAKQQPAEVLIQAIAKPSHDISHGYEGSLLVSTDGVKIAGMVLSNADPVLIKCMGNVVQTIPRKRVSSLMPLGRSLMYDPAVLGLNAQAIADIAAYLRSL
jgi:putative heme-binding domain-containing protein